MTGRRRADGTDDEKLGQQRSSKIRSRSSYEEALIVNCKSKLTVMSDSITQQDVVPKIHSQFPAPRTQRWPHLASSMDLDAMTASSNSWINRFGREHMSR
jgi:hypothetical protein